MVAPVIPVLTDHEMERILEAAAAAGARSAAYVLLRLPYELKDLFREWLRDERTAEGEARDVAPAGDARRHATTTRAWACVSAARANTPSCSRSRFAAACARLGLKQRERFAHNLTLFRPPVFGPEQLSLL